MFARSDGNNAATMSFRYFAYGSNLWVPQMRSRCSSARPVRTAVLEGWDLAYDKPSTDGSAKLNIRPAPGGSVHGVVYELSDDDRPVLDAAEPLYTPIEVTVGDETALTYTYEGGHSDRNPYDWYVSIVRAGADSHGLPTNDHDITADPDPIAPGVRPGHDELDLMRDILSEGVGEDDERYYIHPGDLSWWRYHADPRFPDHDTYWVQGDSALAVIDARPPGEINVFARPGVDRVPLLRWCQRRLDGRGEVAWVSDTDRELVSYLEGEGYETVHIDRSYRWDLTGDLPEPALPEGWVLRSVLGEHEANQRRRASHAAFESTMPEAMHLQRYLDFMRSPAYVPEHDLVAVAPDGRIASFMVWWDDETGVAQIEPFGTHPDFHRQGIGRALLYHGLHRMRDEGMRACRVVTDDYREATSFYEGVGFRDVGRLRWWARR
jgi:ribosomal protein S18 acetylase RimI-like enzyme